MKFFSRRFDFQRLTLFWRGHVKRRSEFSKNFGFFMEKPSAGS